ncbi:hypothetical protein TPMD04_42 [Thiohalocapsa phage LS06-2018-MD04]|nr:hypothetical protein TPMD04_42 [Thiohalocapsa phage LS06-2018-MD04]
MLPSTSTAKTAWRLFDRSSLRWSEGSGSTLFKLSKGCTLNLSSQDALVSRGWEAKRLRSRRRFFQS